MRGKNESLNYRKHLNKVMEYKPPPRSDELPLTGPKQEIYKELERVRDEEPERYPEFCREMVIKLKEL